jgi:hypothetical protein
LQQTAVGVRARDISTVTEDLKERGLYKQGMSEVAQRREMESSLRLEDEKKQMEVLMRDRRFEGRGGKVSEDIGRVLIDTLHVPMWMIEKALHVLYSVAHNNKTKKNRPPECSVK